MITWMDFVLDDEVGAVLMVPETEGEIVVATTRLTQGRRKRLGSQGIMEDAKGKIIQETGQEQRPARMVGLSNSVSIAEAGKDAGVGYRASVLRQGGEG